MKGSLHLGLNLVDPGAYGGWPGYLKACCADAADMSALFARAGFTASGVINHAATISRVRDELEAAAAHMTAGDWFVLTYSGHGGRGTAWGGFGTVETLCLFDGQFPDYDLKLLLAGFQPGVNVVLILDCCHSGGMDRGSARVKAAPSWATERMERWDVMDRMDRKAATPNVMILAACRADEVSLDGEENGAFTMSLLRTMVNGMSYAGWMGMSAAFCAEKFPLQHPQLIEVCGEKLGGKAVMG